MMSRTLWAAGVLTLAMTLTGCGQSDHDQDQAASGGDGGNAPKTVNLIFGTGGTSGTYYPIGGALKRVFEQSDRVHNVQVVSTGASDRKSVV